MRILFVPIAALSFLFADRGQAQVEEPGDARPTTQTRPPDADAGTDRVAASAPADSSSTGSAKPEPKIAPKGLPRPAEDALESEEALGRFAQILIKRPLHGPAFQGLVKHYAEKSKLGDLVKEYEQKTAAMPDQVNLRIVLARVYLRAGQAQKAAEIVDQVTGPSGTSAEDKSGWLLLKSEVYQQVNRNDAAQKMLAEALAAARTVAERFKLAEALAELYVRGGDNKGAAQVLVNLGKEFPDSYLHRKRVADCLADRGLHDDAAGQYREILTLVADQNDKRCEVLRQLGRCFEQLDKKQEAIEAYREAVGLLSSGHWLQKELNERIVTLYRASDRLKDLEAYCRKQIEESPEQTSIRVLLAEVLAATGNADGAKKALADAVELFPRDRMLSEKRVQLLERLADAAGIAAEYERIIGQYPDDVELYIGYGQYLANNKQLEAARNQWIHVLKSEVADASLALRLGALFEPHELLDDAVECYERSIKLAPQLPEAYTALSRLWLFRGKKDQAIAALERMTAANPRDATAHATVSQAMSNLGLAEEALKAIEKACELDGKQVNYQLTRSDLLVQVGRVNDALAVRRQALDLIVNPGQLANAIDVLVSMYASSNQLDALTKAETERLEKDPKNVLCLLLLADAADFDRRMVDAKKWLTRLVEIEPSHEAARRKLAQMHEAIGDVDSAVDAYRKLVDLYPARARQYFQAIADLKLRYNDKAGTVEILERLVQASPGNATVQKSVAEQFVRLQEFDKAIALYEQSLKSQSEQPDLRLAYGKALQEAGRLDDAMAAFKAAALQQRDRDTAIEALGRLHETAGLLGRIDELLQDLQARVESNRDETAVARMLAEVLIHEFEYNRAIDVLDLVLRHHSRDPELLLVRGEVLRRLARFDESVETYRSILRLPNIDRDFVLGEIGKAYCESGRIDQARAVWRQVANKLYAGSLLRNNGLADDAIDVIREGIRLKPDDFALHRNLIGAYQAAGKVEEAIDAAKKLLDLEPDNVINIEQVAKAYLERSNRSAAAEVAGRLFSAGVTEKKDSSAGGSGSSRSGMGGAPLWAVSMQSAWGRQNQARNNLERGVAFFKENGLLTELEETLSRQLKIQPDNALLRETAAELFTDTFGKPEISLELLKDLETASFPIEHQRWLGQCSQRDYMRVQQYQLIGSKPGLRDKRLAVLEPKPLDALTREEALELAVIRQTQGSTDSAIDLLGRVIKADANDTVALSAMVDTLNRAERFEDAEPHAAALIAILSKQRDQAASDMVERVRRDFVRTLPLQFQVRVSEELLRDIADKWTLGQSMVGDFTGFVQVMGLFRARLSLATIYAKTERIDKAKEVWKTLEPRNAADSDGWTMLAGVAQLHEQDQLAYQYYEKALGAAKLLAADPLLRQIYGGSIATAWYGSEQGIDSAFNKIVEAFSGQNKLIELYDFLRDTDQTAKAKRVAEQYKLYDQLKTLYGTRLQEAREEFKLGGGSDPLHASVAYFTQACKLAELHDQTGAWAEAEKIYEQYLSDYSLELGLLQTLGEVAEAQEEFERAVAWEKKVLDAQERLSRSAREWALRTLYVTPIMPQVLENETDQWTWQARWGRNSWWGYGSQQDPLERWPTWLRVAQLYLSLDNPIASGDALERAMGAAGSDRKEVGERILKLIQQRQLTAKMLPVLRCLAVQLPLEERVQLAFAESLEANQKGDIAGEVYRRMLRRGVSDISTLARIRDKLKVLEPVTAEAGDSKDTLESLEALVQANPENAGNRLRLAKAYYYSLEMDKAIEMLTAVEKVAPHLEGLQDLLIEVHTLKQNGPELVKAIQAKIKRTKDEDAKRETRRRLVVELLSQDRKDEALKELKDLVDPRNPESYQAVGLLLHYFGLHDEAIKQFELSGRSQQRGGGWNSSDMSGNAIAKAEFIKGDLKAAADRIIKAANEQAKQATQYGGMAGMYAMYIDEDGQNPFNVHSELFALKPELLDDIESRLKAAYEAKPDDPQAAKQLMQLYQSVGRNDRADAILDKLGSKSTSDQSMVSRLIDRAVERREYDKAIEMATKWIEQQPKPTLPPGIPAQFAGMMTLMSPRNMMICKLGDIHWKKGDKDKAFENYKRILDEKVDETRLAYASICALRGRIDESRRLVEDALTKQKVKSPLLLQFRAVLSMLDGDTAGAFDMLAEAVEIGGGREANPFGGGGDTVDVQMLAGFAKTNNMLDKFAEVARKRIKKNPSEWANYDLLAGAFHDAGRMDEALAVLDEAGKVKSLHGKVVTKQLEWKQTTAPADEIIGLYRELIELSEKKVKKSSGGMSAFFGGSPSDDAPVDTQALRDRLATLLWRQSKHAEAEKAWTERLNLNSAQGQAALGNRFLEKEEPEKALACFKKALELEPNNTGVRWSAARLAFERGDPEGLADHLRELFLKRNQSAAPENRQNQYYDEWGERQNQGENDLQFWALQVSNSAKASEAISPENKADYDLAVSVLTGDWPAAEKQLSERLKTSAYDPYTWNLWARLCERKGQWEEAAAAWEYLKRISRTTLPNRQDKLKLVLAGKHIKEAAAGTRQAGGMQQPPMPGPGMNNRQFFSQSSYYGGYMPYGDVDSRLASIYIKLNQFDKAEQLYLLGDRGQGAAMLPTLASLMWRQDAKPRAVELMQLAVILSEQRYQQLIPQYASLLAETDRTDEAIELLVRNYRMLSTQENSRGYGRAFMYRNFNDGSQEQFEDYQESACSSALYELLRREKGLDARLKTLNDQIAGDPNDTRLAKLVLSLELRDRRWTDARKTLADWCKARPQDSSIKTELMHACMQAGDWDAAMTVLAELKADAQMPASRWAMQEAFIRLMQGKPADAVAAVEPLLKKPLLNDEGATRDQLQALLLATRQYDRLIQYIESRDARMPVDDAELERLCELYRASGRLQEAADRAFKAHWNAPGALSASSKWYCRLHAVASQASVAGKSIATAPERPEDAAMLVMLRDGAQAGREAFSRLVESDPDNLNARRGIVLAADAAGDRAGAIAANQALIEWLEPKRHRIFRPAQKPAMADAVAAYIEQMQSGTRDATSVMGMSGEFSSLVGEVMNIGGGSQEEVRYEKVWLAQQSLHRELLCRAGRMDDLVACLKNQAALAEDAAATQSNEPRRYPVRYRGGRTYYTDYGNRNQRDPWGWLPTDWRDAERDLLDRFGLNERAAECAAERGLRLPSNDWPRAAEAFAALGRMDEARLWRDRSVDAHWTSLQSSDGPSVETGNNYYWYWRMYGNMDDQSVQSIRRALNEGPDRSIAVSSDAPDKADIDDTDEADESDQRSFYSDVPNSVWKVALAEDDPKQRMAELDRLVGPGWESSRSVAELSYYWWARKEPARLIELVERVWGTDRLLESNQLSGYVRACYTVKDYERLRKLLDAAEKKSPSLQNSVALNRLVIERLTNRNDEAAKLEKALLERCQREPSNPNRIESRFELKFDRSQPVYYRGGYQPWRFQSSPDLATVAALAGALGVRFDTQLHERDLTLLQIRGAYARHDLFLDAARIADLELAQLTSSAADRERIEIVQSKANLLARAGQAADAKVPLKEAESYWKAQIKTHPDDAECYRRLEALYNMKAAGPDRAGALQMLREAKSRDLSLDAPGNFEADSLYRGKDRAAAWEKYKGAISQGKFFDARRHWNQAGPTGINDFTTALYRAGLSAAQAGDAPAANILIRQALWRNPRHRLADKGRELIHETN